MSGTAGIPAPSGRGGRQRVYLDKALEITASGRPAPPPDHPPA